MRKRPLTLNTSSKQKVLEELREYVSEELDVDMGDLKADLFLDFIIDTCGKEFYNRGVKDAKNFLFTKLEDLEIDTDQLLK